MRGVKQIILTVLAGLVVTACRTSQTSDAARIHAQKSTDLVAWLSWDRLPKDLQDHDPVFLASVCDELVSRREVDFLLASLNASTNEHAREWLVSEVLYRIDDHRVSGAFTRCLSDKEDRESYYVALYLAERGDATALTTLNRHYFAYPVASFEWASATEIFGKYKYIPATTNLVDSLNAASLNVSAAACNALQEIFPDSPKHFGGPTEARNYYIKRLRETPH
jgi:hypothetical protein